VIRVNAGDVGRVSPLVAEPKMCVFAALSILRMCVRNARSVLIISEQTRAALLNSFHLIGRPRVIFHISVCVCVCVCVCVGGTRGRLFYLYSFYTVVVHRIKAAVIALSNSSIQFCGFKEQREFYIWKL